MLVKKWDYVKFEENPFLNKAVYFRVSSLWKMILPFIKNLVLNQELYPFSSESCKKNRRGYSNF